MTIFVVDVEADGPCPGLYSMIEVGAVRLDRDLDKRFFSTLRPITDRFEKGALDSIGATRDQTLSYEDPEQAIISFADWVNENSDGRATFLSDNNGFDWQFVNYYFTYYLGAGKNPFGHSSRRIGDIYSGAKKNFFERQAWKKLRKTRHTHNALDDAVGNAEAALSFFRSEGIIRRHYEESMSEPRRPALK